MTLKKVSNQNILSMITLVESEGIAKHKIVLLEEIQGWHFDHIIGDDWSIEVCWQMGDNRKKKALFCSAKLHDGCENAKQLKTAKEVVSFLWSKLGEEYEQEKKSEVPRNWKAQGLKKFAVSTVQYMLKSDKEVVKGDMWVAGKQQKEVVIVEDGYAYSKDIGGCE